jgi:hypothetical protein
MVLATRRKKDASAPKVIQGARARAHEVVSPNCFLVDHFIGLETCAFIGQPRRPVCRQHSDPDAPDTSRIKVRDDCFKQLVRNSLPVGIRSLRRVFLVLDLAGPSRFPLSSAEGGGLVLVAEDGDEFVGVAARRSANRVS